MMTQLLKNARFTKPQWINAFPITINTSVWRISSLGYCAWNRKYALMILSVPFCRLLPLYFTLQINASDTLFTNSLLAHNRNILKKIVALTMSFQWLNHITVLHMPRQLSCRDMCKIVTCSEQCCPYKGNIHSTRFRLRAHQPYVTCFPSSSQPGVGVTKPIFSVPLISRFFNIDKTLVTYWISCSYLTGVAAAQLRWHLSNMNVMQII